MATPLLQPDEQITPKAQALLDAAKQQLGFLPNMYRNMAQAPHLLEHYLHGYNRFRSDSSFSSAEQEVVFLAISRENDCRYCLAAHSTLADKVSQVPIEVTDAIRDENPIPDPRLRALHDFTRTCVRKRGHLTRDDIYAFMAAGFNKQQVLDVLLAISVKTISNYSNHLFATPLDDIFAARAIDDRRTGDIS